MLDKIFAKKRDRLRYETKRALHFLLTMHSNFITYKKNLKKIYIYIHV